jgi:hypothetical protein
MSDQSPEFPPGTGVYRPPREEARGPDQDHMRGWNIAIQNALKNIGRSPGFFAVNVTLSATVEVENPGYVVEYIAKII